MFDPTKFKTVTLNAFQKIREVRAIKDGVDPLAGLKARHTNGASLIARRDDERVLVVLVENTYNARSKEYFATLYWGAKPQEVWESLTETRKFLDLSGEWSYNGPLELSAIEAYALLVRLAAGEQDL